jgi:hypothetical protein
MTMVVEGTASSTPTEPQRSNSASLHETARELPGGPQFGPAA